MWISSDAHAPVLWMNSNTWDASAWEDILSGPLRLQGEGAYIHETIRMANEPQNNVVGLWDQAASLTSDMTVNYPGGGKYTMDAGFFSLYGGSSNETWTASNGTAISLNHQLPSAYTQGIIPSISYGMHLGSPTYGITGSLVLGGYDRSRCFTDPITSNNSTFVLTDLSLEVLEGRSYFTGSPITQNGLLFLGNGATSLNVIPNPGVPYMYLPRATCDVIASYLPVTYDSALGLYTWNTLDSAFSGMMSSPHVLSFTFSSLTTTANTTIHVPLALLNLTLETPLVSTPTFYFPCSPYTPSDGSTYHLGRAFLQSAFFAQNWQASRTWLAQAPGPNFPPQVTTVLQPTDDTLAAMANAPSWLSTWDGVLKASNVSSTIPTSASSYTAPNKLSPGTIAGIVVGAVAGLALVAGMLFLLWRRRRRSQRREEVPEYQLADQKMAPEIPEVSETSETFEAGGHAVYGNEASNSEIHEIGGAGAGMYSGKRGKRGSWHKIVEADNEVQVSELPGQVSELPGADVGESFRGEYR